MLVKQISAAHLCAKMLAPMLFALSILPTLSLAAELESITVTATRYTQSVAELMGNLGVVSEDQLRLIGHSHINEALTQVPGTWISRGNGQEHLTAIRSPVFTGAGACGAFLMAEDGIPLLAAGFCNANQLLMANSEQAQRIDVIRGPTTALYGSNAMHGVIHVINEPVAETTDTRLFLESGAHDYQRIKFSSSERLEDKGYRLSFNATHDGGYKDDSGYDQQKLYLRHEFNGTIFDTNLQAQTTLVATNLNQETAAYVRGTDAYKDSSRQSENPNPEAYRNVHSARLSSRLHFTFNNSNNSKHGNGELLLTPYLRYSAMQFLQHYVPWKALEENGQKSLGLLTAYRFMAKPDTANPWQVISGVDLEYTQAFLKETQAEEFSPNIPRGTHYDYRVDALVVAPYLRLQWQLGSNTTLAAGARFEHIRYDYDNRSDNGSACPATVTNCRFYRPSDRIDSFNEWSPKLSILHTLADNLSLHASINRGFRSPQATELYRLQNGPQSAELDVEQLQSIEVGFRFRTEQWQLESNLFAMRKRNFIFLDTQRQNINKGKTRHKGVEFDLNVFLPRDFDLALGLTFARHRYDNSIAISNIDIKGNDIDTAPRHMGSLKLGWNFGYKLGSRAELQLAHMGSYYENPENTSRYNGHNIWHLRLSHGLTPHWQIAARITNIGNQDYAERADFSFGSKRYFIGEPRAVSFSIEGKY